MTEKLPVVWFAKLRSNMEIVRTGRIFRSVGELMLVGSKATGALLTGTFIAIRLECRFSLLKGWAYSMTHYSIPCALLAE